MDKDDYETNYELLSATNEPNVEFFLVQEDGTFLINKSGGPMVSEGNSDQSTVYDISQTQFLVNNTCLVTVPDSYIVADSSTPTSDVYGNKDPILQSAPEDAPEEDTELQSTEITLTNEQYNLLEKNGWCLLETGDKAFMLDSSGLQDITTNVDLIQQLKAEIQNNCQEVRVKPTRSVLKNDLRIHPAQRSNEQQPSQTNEDTIELVFGNDYVAVESTNAAGIASNDSVDINDKELDNSEEIEPTESLSNHLQSQNVTVNQNAKESKGSSLRGFESAKPTISNPLKLKTEYCLRDIPERIILGKTVNGKNLVARVTTIISCPQNKPNNLKGFIKKDKTSSINKSASKTPKTKVEPKLLSKQVAWRNASHLRNLPIGRGRSTEDDGGEMMFVQALEGAVGGPLTGKQMAIAETVAVQLMQMPALLPMIENANLIVTKIIKIGDKPTSGEANSCLESCILTGRMSTNGSNPQFIHIPTLIQDILEERSKNPRQSTKAADEACVVLHIHITETKYNNQEDAISITLNKRSLQQRKQTTTFECGICATTLKSADELAEHQENHDMDSEDILTIDTENVDSEIEDDQLQLVMLNQ